jgi:pilus assembly protein FimV
VPLISGAAEVLVECREWAAAPPGWDGRATITAVAAAAAGEEPARAELELVVAAVELVPETTPAREVYVARGAYDNDAFIAGLRAVLDGLDVPLVVHEAGRWQEMATKLDLASAYEEIGDKEGARELLQEVIKGGDNGQQQKARAMLSKIG